MFRYLIFPLIICNIVFADDLSGDAEVIIEEPQDRIPALELLPVGSILKNISITRYNNDYTSASLLSADQFVVINDQEIKGRNVSILLYDIKGEIKAQTKLDTVDYNQTNGLITSKENLTFSNDMFTASSQGVTLDWENHRGFLLGKNQTIIYLKVPTSMTNTSNTLQQPVKKNIKANSISKIGAAATAAAIATSPAFLSAQDLAQLDQLTLPSTALFIDQIDQTKAVLAASAEAEAKIAAVRKELSDQLGSIPKIDESQPIPPELIPTKGKDFVHITSDHLLFDAKKGIFVYYGNVRLTHPKYSFSCDGELKIILSQSAAAKKLSPEERNELKPKELFDSVQQIIATKNVVFRGKDKKGKDVVGVTENLIAQNISMLKIKDSKTGKTDTVVKGDIILRGKNSRLTAADGQLKVITQNGYIKIDHDFNVSGQGTATDFIVPDNAKQPEKPKNN